MNLIVKSSSVLNHHQENSYWNKLNRISIASGRENKSYSWLLKYLNPNDNIILLGGSGNYTGGNSSLAAHLSDDGFKLITKLDTTAELKNKIDQLAHLSDHFNIFLDEGLLNNLNKSDDFEILFKKISQLVKVGGRYISFSLLRQNFLSSGPIPYFHHLGWKVQVYLCDKETKSTEIEPKSADSIISHPTFGIVCTKVENACNALEFCPKDSEILHFSNLEDLVKRVQSFQHLAIIENQLTSLQNRYLPQEISLELIDLSVETKSTKYRIYIVDRQVETTNKFAAFVVPQGRETDWMFKSRDGRSQFTYDAQFQRLVLILLGREHHFENLEIVQTDLADLVLRLQPNELPPNYKIPFISFGNKINQQKKEIHRGVGYFSGEYVVEDVEDEDEDGNVFTIRQLVYLSDNTFVETQVRLKQGEVDVEYPPTGYHMAMVDELQQNLLVNEDLTNVLAIGVGGGALASYLNAKFPNLPIDAVEIDPEIVEVAQRFFGLTPGPNLRLHCADGLIYVKDLASDPDGMRYGCIILDVDCKDNEGSAMQAPTASFVETTFISCLKTCLKRNGVLIINFLVIDDDCLQRKVIDTFQESFAHVKVKKVQEEINKILVCINNL